MVQTQTEVQRISEVYRTYQESEKVQASWSKETLGNRFLLRERENKLICMLRKYGYYPFGKLKILEVGCGIGENLRKLCDWGADPNNLFGVDLLQDRVKQAKKNLPAINFLNMNADGLTFED